MENSSILVVKFGIVADNASKKFSVLCQRSSSSKQPTVSEFSLIDIESWNSTVNEFRIIADFLWTFPFIFTIRSAWIVQASISRRELWVFEKFSSCETLLANFVKVLDISLTTISTDFFTELDWKKPWTTRFWRKLKKNHHKNRPIIKRVLSVYGRHFSLFLCSLRLSQFDVQISTESVLIATLVFNQDNGWNFIKKIFCPFLHNAEICDFVSVWYQN